MKRIISVCLLSVLFFACSSSKKLEANNNSTKNTSSLKDGSSMANAVVINEKSETAGVSKEYEWLREKYPGHTVKSQSLITTNGKPYDIINITTANGEEKKIYFDISKFYGKF